MNPKPNPDNPDLAYLSNKVTDDDLPTSKMELLQRLLAFEQDPVFIWLLVKLDREADLTLETIATEVPTSVGAFLAREQMLGRVAGVRRLRELIKHYKLNLAAELQKHER